ncbi:hypothetical protein [Aquimarina rhabdastrellae]
MRKIFFIAILGMVSLFSCDTEKNEDNNLDFNPIIEVSDYFDISENNVSLKNTDSNKAKELESLLTTFARNAILENANAIYDFEIVDLFNKDSSKKYLLFRVGDDVETINVAFEMNNDVSSFDDVNTSSFGGEFHLCQGNCSPCGFHTSKGQIIGCQCACNHTILWWDGIK